MCSNVLNISPWFWLKTCRSVRYILCYLFRPKTCRSVCYILCYLFGPMTCISCLNLNIMLSLDLGIVLYVIWTRICRTVGCSLCFPLVLDQGLVEQLAIHYTFVLPLDWEQGFVREFVMHTTSTSWLKPRTCQIIDCRKSGYTLYYKLYWSCIN